MNTRWTAGPVAALALVAAGASSAFAAGSPCALLTPAEISAFVPGAKAGKVDPSAEKYDIQSCEWSTADGRVVASRWKAEPGDTALEEIRSLVSGSVDPLNPAALRNVRFETVAGVGEQAVAVVEVPDASRGIIAHTSVLVAKRGDQILVLMASNLPRSDRARALAGLKALGLKAVARL